jgi:hypothetical protein
MRPFHVAFLLVVVSAPLAAAPAQPQAGKGKTGMFRGAYDPPKDPKHQAIYQQLKNERALERFGEALSAIRLPKPLVLKFASCDGTSNAWYEPADGTVTFCYEYVAEIQKGAAGSMAAGIPTETAWQGAVAFVLLHETGHALFDILKVPILGREEDAADNVAAFIMLRAGEGIARKVLGGAAWMYLHDSKGRMPDESDFADVHGLDSQRFYNVLCMAYGSSQASFKGMVDKGYLPKDRAEGCAEEFKQVAYAVKQLIDPSVDAELAARIKAAHKMRWEKPAETAETQPLPK